MKKQFMRVVNTNLFSKFIRSTIIVFMLAGAVNAEAQATVVSEMYTEPGAGVGNTVITHVATNSEAIFFDVKIENAAGERFLIIIKDNEGNTLYRAAYSDKDFKKTFRLPKGESEKITFLVKSDSGTKSESFEINSNTRLVEEVIVKKVI
jgi:hypothetical protein